MGWEKRGNGTYYYAKERHGSRVLSRYVGYLEERSPLDDIDQAEEAKRQAQIEALEATSDEAEEAARLLTDLTLIALGFHQHKRTWRMMRDVEESEP